VTTVGDPLLSRPLLPVANEDDAAATCRAVFPRLAENGGSALMLHVIEKAGGAPDKAPVEQREALAEEFFEEAREYAESYGIDIETRLAYGTDVADTIIDVAHEIDASAVVFTPRGGSRWVNLITGDVSYELVEHSDLPVVVLPDVDEEASEPVVGRDADDTTGEETDDAAGDDADDATGDAAGGAE
jgi:nucleotide-binding universal stress UspA family protein